MTYPPNHITKAIAYAYPTSTQAAALGYAKTGCYFVQQTRHNIEGSGQARTYCARNCEGFSTPDDPDLIALFREYEGRTCPLFSQYGNSNALAAIAKERN
jgi:hypothetical protein